ncbi:hypothetical protein PUN28_001223 [Cardiocondyla obscurior]|uniref:Secreted protein n=1 Tax=Cardiocondyla obscurior TaxID=286306 RepID=A0AAW2H3V4_9HYME
MAIASAAASAMASAVALAIASAIASATASGKASAVASGKASGVASALGSAKAIALPVIVMNYNVVRIYYYLQKKVKLINCRSAFKCLIKKNRLSTVGRNLKKHEAERDDAETQTEPA